MGATVRILILVLAVMGGHSCSGSHKNESARSMTEVSEEMANEPVYETEDASSKMYASIDMEKEVSNYAFSENRKKTAAPPVKNELTGSIPSNFLASPAASVINSDEVHQLIRNVQMKFKVKDVPQTTYDIESIVLKNGGHIRRSAINNSRSYSSTVNISRDSAIIIHHNNLTANIQFRVHYSRLDTVLREIAPYAVHIDYRNVDVRDVTFDLIWEKMKKERMAKKQKRISAAIDNRGRKLDDIMDAEQALDYSAEQEDRALLEDYKMKDQIEYSTINVEIYQHPTQYQERVLRTKSIDEYEPSLGAKMLSALQNGWEMVAALFILLLNIWPFILVVIAGICVGIYFRNKKRKDDL